VSDNNPQFTAVAAEWRCPDIRVESGGPGLSSVAEWVGFDNASRLFQAGTNSQCLNFLDLNWYAFTSYSMWLEGFPDLPFGEVSVGPGDHVSVTMFAADEDGTTWFDDTKNDSMWFMLTNLTTRTGFWGTLPDVNSDGTRFVASRVAFIVERPSDNGVAEPLANFGAATMWNCIYWRYHQSATLNGLDTSPISYLNMFGPSGHLLANVVPGFLHGPTGLSDLSELLWVWQGYE
jgi:hypothetical protein